LSNHEVYEFPPFDASTDQETPFLGFGDILEHSARAEKAFHEAAAMMRERVREGFGVKLNDPSEIPGELDGIVSHMWATGWDPNVGNVSLFLTDFSLILSEAMLDSMGGKLVFRTTGNFDQCSIFWANARIEAFPFHKVVKCLFAPEGESMAHYVRGLAALLRNHSGRY